MIFIYSMCLLFCYIFNIEDRQILVNICGWGALIEAMIFEFIILDKIFNKIERK